MAQACSDDNKDFKTSLGASSAAQEVYERPTPLCLQELFEDGSASQAHSESNFMCNPSAYVTDFRVRDISAF